MEAGGDRGGTVAQNAGLGRGEVVGAEDGGSGEAKLYPVTVDATGAAVEDWRQLERFFWRYNKVCGRSWVGGWVVACWPAGCLRMVAQQGGSGLLALWCMQVRSSTHHPHAGIMVCWHDGRIMCWYARIYLWK